ncbi:hypothetical protein RD110_18965 [Rhodoferax koreense]|uniref:Pilus assembly protein PilW n=1 Tax=Rhodoferax koreensis TaxID=1842727 RepID=A0A1P8JZ54_9BURK|nr:PilW family protein [Rhodoferax koreense]APW39033.1 hypothetical protein RD110_18965 [Rhodoferax koreense]
MNQRKLFHRQRGVSLIELMVTMAITMFLVAAAAYVYLGTRETQRAVERNSSNVDTGTFAMQLIGQEIMKAGYYPANTSRVLTAAEGYPKLSYYPPTKLAENAAQATDWTPPTTATPGIYLSGLFGCNGGTYLPATGTCPASSDTAPDSIVINYFTNDKLGAGVGDRTDCTGADVANDPSNTNRLNTTNIEAPPLQPLFVSNRFAITATQTEIEKQAVSTFSLSCNGNGATTPTNIYQPLLPGIEDMQFTYGVFAVSADSGSRTPEKFYTATEVSALAAVNVDNGMFVVSTPAWSRVSAVRVCIMVKSQGANPKIADKAGAERSYVDCKGATQTQGASDSSLRRKFEQTFVLRNRMSVVY